MLIVCLWCVEEILMPIVGAAGYCSWDCQEAAVHRPAADDELAPAAGRPRLPRRVRVRRRPVRPALRDS
ncbi:hypothetical protein BBK14_16605 [Parafrankia soli]|uniref:Uncharacterized protein n=1 Tax=Parafrankia soli TaxID=2599596 RepID=A0A1S1QAK5_9ACTN|nr:hypothetical protein BBK14_16605 [Parafrankia soli]